ncbi:MAG: bifunctional nuclease family protein [Zavarzinella sp.]
MPVQMELRRIIISDINDKQLIVLREVDGDRSFTIVIGSYEANSIERRIKKVFASRPLTHDLVVNAIENMGGEIQDILINDLQDQTYFARLRVQRHGELVEIDCRPSDAIAIAVTADVPIFVAEAVLNELENDPPYLL